MMNRESWEPQTAFVRDIIARREAARQESFANGYDLGERFGHVVARRDALRTVFSARRFDLTESANALIDACEDAAVLDRWTRVAVMAESIDDVTPALYEYTGTPRASSIDPELRAIRDDLVAWFTRSPSALFALAPTLAVAREARTRCEDLTHSVRVEHRAAALLGLGDPHKSLVVIDVQTTIDLRKRWLWPLQIAAASARHEIPCGLVVVALSESVADWADEPIPVGSAGELRPIVISRDRVAEAQRSSRATE